jgi:hypothetical protein
MTANGSRVPTFQVGKTQIAAPIQGAQSNKPAGGTVAGNGNVVDMQALHRSEQLAASQALFAKAGINTGGTQATAAPWATKGAGNEAAGGSSNGGNA